MVNKTFILKDDLRGRVKSEQVYFSCLHFCSELICSFHNKYEAVQDESQSDSGEPERPGSRTPLVTRQLAPSYRHGLKSSTHILLSVSYVLQQFISLCLMLVFMTFNLYLCLTVVFSAGLGFYLFAWKRIILSGNMIQTTPDCH